MEKIGKKTKIIIFLILIFLTIAWNLTYNLPKTIERVTGIVLGTKLKSKSIKKMGNKILIEDFEIVTKDEKIIATPLVEIVFSKENLKKLRIDEIIVNGGVANITRLKGGDINIVRAFTGESKEKEKEEDEEYTPGISIPIDKITVKDIFLTFRDLNYRLPIEKSTTNTSGYVTFSKTKGIEMDFSGINDEEKYNFYFTTEKEPYSMTLKFLDINVDTTLIQYGYDGEEISCNDGILNMDLTIADSGMRGWIDFYDVNVRYRDLDDNIPVEYGVVNFKEDGIYLEADSIVFNKKEKFYLQYVDNQLDIDFDLENIDKKSIEKLSYLNGIELPFEKINVDKLKFNLNLKEELKITINGEIKKLLKDNFELENTTTTFIYDNNGIHIKELDTTASLYDENKNLKLQEKLKMSLDLKENIGNLKLNLENSNNLLYIPDFNGKLDFELGEKIKFFLSSNILDLKGEYDKEKQKFLLEDKEYNLIYDVEKKEFLSGKGKIGINYLNNIAKIFYNVENNNFKELGIEIRDKNSTLPQLQIKGDLNLVDFKYSFDILGKNMNFSSEIENTPIFLKGSLTGNIENKKETLNGNLKFDKFGLKYIGEMNGLTGELKLSQNSKIYLEFLGEIGRLKYDKYYLDGFLVNFRMKNNKLEIKSFDNRAITSSGEIDFNTQKILLDLKVNNLLSEKFGEGIPKFTMEEALFYLSGKYTNPQLNARIKNLDFVVNKDESVKLNGDIQLLEKKLTLYDFEINNSILNGEFDIGTKKYSGKVNIIEENIGRYYSDRNLKYRVIGLLDIDGDLEKIKLSLKSTVDKIYLRGEKLPDIYLDTEYEGYTKFTDIVKINRISFKDKENREIFYGSGNFDIEKKYLDFRLPAQKLELSLLTPYIKFDGLKGELNLYGECIGNIDDLKYSLVLKNNVIELFEENVDNILISVSGTPKKISLDDLSFEYLKNKFISSGHYNVESGDYLYLAKSEKVDLSFFNKFLSKFKFSDIKGEANVNLRLANNSNYGVIDIKRLSLKNEEYGIYLDNLDSQIKLEGDKLYLAKFTGDLNGGKVNSKGFIGLPTLKDINENPNFKENLNYNLQLSLNDIKYKYQKFFSFDLNSEINLSKDDIKGDINISNGIINAIPIESKGIFQILKEKLYSFISPTVNNSEDLGKDFQIATVFENDFAVDIKLRIKDKIKLEIEELFSVISDMEGDVVGNLNLKGKKGKYGILGNIEILNGSFEFNDNTFKLEKALLSFNDERIYLPKFNPVLRVESKVETSSDDVNIGINGNLDNLSFNIASKQGSSSGSLNSLITSEGSVNLEGNNQATTTLLTNIVGGQLTQIVKPITKLVKNTFKIHKLKLISNFKTEETKTQRNDGETRYSLDTAIYAEDNIYKDKLWWIAKGTLFRGDNGEKEKNISEKDDGLFKDYDLMLEYRFKNDRSIGIGVGKLPIEYQSIRDDRKHNSKNLNYHIDFKIKKRYNSISEIFMIDDGGN